MGRMRGRLYPEGEHEEGPRHRAARPLERCSSFGQDERSNISVSASSLLREVIGLTRIVSAVTRSSFGSGESGPGCTRTSLVPDHWVSRYLTGFVGKPKPEVGAYGGTCVGTYLYMHLGRLLGGSECSQG